MGCLLRFPQIRHDKPLKNDGRKNAGGVPIARSRVLELGARDLFVGLAGLLCNDSRLANPFFTSLHSTFYVCSCSERNAFTLFILNNRDHESLASGML
jgi:hypothetical protein